MKLEILGSFGGNADTYRLTSLLVNDCLALDAGCLTSALTFERQLPIRNVMVSHAHSDHIGTLPYLIDNVFGYSDGPLRIHGWTDQADFFWSSSSISSKSASTTSSSAAA